MKNCQKATRASRIKFEERQRKVIFRNDSCDNFVKTSFDGCVVKHQLGADWILSKVGIGDVIVELKGCDIHHAAKQVNSTADFLTQHKCRMGRLAGLIIGSRYPRADTGFQKLQRQFSQKFKGPLRVVNRQAELTFEDALAF